MRGDNLYLRELSGVWRSFEGSIITYSQPRLSLYNAFLKKVIFHLAFINHHHTGVLSWVCIDKDMVEYQGMET